MFKFIEKIEKPNQGNKLKEIRILGLPIYKKSLEWGGRFVKRVFLNGLLVFSYDNKCMTFSLRLFDVDYFEFNILKTQLKLQRFLFRAKLQINEWSIFHSYSSFICHILSSL